MKSKKRNKAIIWDYDGTLVDTRAKNFNVTRKIMRQIVGVASSEYSVLETLENYSLATRRAKNWRELYRNECRLNEDQIDEAGKLWTEYQLSDDSAITLFDGVEEVIRLLSKYPNLVFSQNSRSNIVQELEQRDLLKYFDEIVGYEEVSLSNQKPAPDGLLICVEKIKTADCELVFFIGDHETDTLCGHNANTQLEKYNTDTKIINIAALYGSEDDTSTWAVKPDCIVNNVRAIADYIDSY